MDEALSTNNSATISGLVLTPGFAIFTPYREANKSPHPLAAAVRHIFTRSDRGHVATRETVGAFDSCVSIACEGLRTPISRV